MLSSTRILVTWNSSFYFFQSGPDYAFNLSDSYVSTVYTVLYRPLEVFVEEAIIVPSTISVHQHSITLEQLEEHVHYAIAVQAMYVSRQSNNYTSVYSDEVTATTLQDGKCGRKCSKQ